MEGLASTLTNTYGNGEGQNTTHFYGGIMDKPRKKKKKKNKKQVRLKENR